jgi:hypothetical protein
VSDQFIDDVQAAVTGSDVEGCATTVCRTVGQRQIGVQ